MLPSYAPFHLQNAPTSPIFVCHITEGKIPFSPVGTEVGLFDCGGISHHVLRNKEGGYLMLVSSANGNAAAMKTNENFSRCEISLFGDLANRSLGLNNALMIAYAFSACHHETLLMHSSVPILNNRGYLFLGKSGTGKSTHSRLWLKHIEGTELLNDDNPALRIMADGSVRVFGTPWSGKTPCYRNHSARVGGILRLEQYPENIIRRESPIHAFASILASCSSMIWDKHSYDAIIHTTEKVAKRIPVCHLRCLPNEAAAHMSYNALTSIHSNDEKNS